MKTLDITEVPEIRDAVNKVTAFENASIKRAQLWLELTGKPDQTFQNGDGFSVKVNIFTLLDPTAQNVVFFHRDVQGGGNTKLVEIPREFLFNETDEEREFLEYKRLQEKFGK